MPFDWDSFNLTVQQKDLLRLLVAKRESTGRMVFNLVQSVDGLGILYGADSGKLAHDYLDFQQLQAGGLVTLISTGENQWRGQLTERGMLFVRSSADCRNDADEPKPDTRVASTSALASSAQQIDDQAEAWHRLRRSFVEHVNDENERLVAHFESSSDKWSFKGSRESERTFKALAREAGFHLTRETGLDAVKHWLDALRTNQVVANILPVLVHASVVMTFETDYPCGALRNNRTAASVVWVEGTNLKLPLSTAAIPR
jgi:hypothetical protein